jgi:hypothetical protein
LKKVKTGSTNCYNVSLFLPHAGLLKNAQNKMRDVFRVTISPSVKKSELQQAHIHVVIIFSGSAAMASTTRFLDHTQRRATVSRTRLGRVIRSSQRPLPDNTQHIQQTHIHAPGEIRNHDRSRRAAVDLRLRPRGHWDPLHTHATFD